MNGPGGKDPKGWVDAVVFWTVVVMALGVWLSDLLWWGSVQ